jgi:hypothetical protein
LIRTMVQPAFASDKPLRQPGVSKNRNLDFKFLCTRSTGVGHRIAILAWNTA